MVTNNKLRPWICLGVLLLARVLPTLAQDLDAASPTVAFKVQPLATAAAGAAPLRAGARARAMLEVRDARTGTPLTGLHPKAWLSKRVTSLVENPPSCKERLQSLVSGSLGSSAAVDMNNYWLVTLNDDSTVTFINPQVAFAPTKLENIVELPGTGLDWTLTKDQRLLFVSLPERDAVALIDTSTRKLLTTISTGPYSKPSRLLLQPDGRYLWVGLDGAANGVAAIDTQKQTLAARIITGAGPHTLAVMPDSARLFVTNSTEDSITAIATETLTTVGRVVVGKTPLAIDYGSAGHVLSVAELNGGHIHFIDPLSLHINKTIVAQPGIVALRFDTGGRFAYAVNQVQSSLSVLDSASARLLETAHVVKEPDQITFTANYAYVRSIGSESFSLIDLKAAQKGDIHNVEIPAGRQAPLQQSGALGVASMLAVAPDGNAVVVANAPDQALYFYQEGMMAPLGSFSNYKRLPRGVLVIDQSLRETAPGVYTTDFRLPAAGRFDAAVLLDKPIASRCFGVAIAPDGNDNDMQHGRRRLRVSYATAQAPTAGTLQSLRFNITDLGDGSQVTALHDVGVMAVLPPGVWQRRGALTALADGGYEWRVRLPQAGTYKLAFSSPSSNNRWTDIPAIEVNATDKTMPLVMKAKVR